MKIGRLLLRATVGGFFVGHGTQKLYGWFGGNGLQATAEGFESWVCDPAGPMRSPRAAPRRAAVRCCSPGSPRRSRPRCSRRRC